MSLDGYIFEGVEIDIPLCSLVWGVGACTAALSTQFPRKCWNLLKHCAVPSAYVTGTPLTLRFCRPGPMPSGEEWFPVLSNVRRSSQSVNVAGTNPDLSGFGRGATLSFDIDDFRWHERGIDPYIAERISGAAQLSGSPIDPETSGMFLAKLRVRWPYYAKAAIRHVSGYLIDGALTERRDISFYMREWSVSDAGRHSMQARGVTDFADQKTALAPKPSPGSLVLDLGASATTFDITPAGAGNTDYAASGWLCLGSEVMFFTRSADTFTVVRGQRGTTAASHSQGATVQQTLSFRGARLDDVVHTLVQDFTDTPADYLDATAIAANQAEVTTWGASILVDTDICTPTGVGILLGELGDLGCTVWEDQVAREIKIRMDRPLKGEATITLTDETMRSLEVKDYDDRRLTQVVFFHNRIDPTKQLSDDANFANALVRVDSEAFTRYGVVSSKSVFCRWLDQGDETTAAIATLRRLDRLREAPKEITVRLSGTTEDYPLVGVVAIESADMAGPDGVTTTQYVQIVQTSEPVVYHDVEAILQAFPFGDRRYGYIAPGEAAIGPFLRDAPVRAEFDAREVAQLWQTDTTATPVAAAGDTVGRFQASSWLSAAVLTQAGAGNRPLWQTSYLDFDGTDDYLEGDAVFRALAQNANSVTIAMRCRVDSLAATNTLFALSTSTSTTVTRFVVDVLTTGRVRVSIRRPDGAATLSSTTASTVITAGADISLVLVVDYIAGTGALYADGGSDLLAWSFGAGAATDNTTSQRGRIGASLSATNLLNGRVYRMAVAQDAPDATERAAIFAELARHDWTYDTATDDERNDYAFIAPDANGFVSDGSAPYLVI